MKSALPPGPRHWLPDLLAITHDIYGGLERLGRRHGETFTLPVARDRVAVMTSDPECVKAIFSAPPEAFRPTLHEMFGPVVGAGSLFLLDGARHIRERQLVGPALHGERMRAHGRTIVRLTRRALDGAVDDELSMTDLANAVTLEVIVRAVFGIEDPARIEMYRHAAVSFLHSYTTPLALFSVLRQDLGPLSPWGRFVRARAAFLALVDQDMAGGGHGVLGWLREAGLGHDQIRDELVTLLLAGHETTERAIAWAIYHLDRDAAVRARLADEIGDLDVADSPERAAALPYLDAVCTEALRLNPVVCDVNRLTLTPFRLLDWDLPAGTIVSACVLLVHRRADLYPEPLRFRPERFLERRYAPNEYIPFGGGTRRCIGQAFALYTMKLVLATIYRYAQIELRDTSPVKPRRQGLAVGPGSALRARIISRRG